MGSKDLSGWVLPGRTGLQADSTNCARRAAKLDPSGSFSVTFTVELAGGSMSTHSTVDDVFKIDNAGSKKIQRIGLYINPKGTSDKTHTVDVDGADSDPEWAVRVDFCNPTSDRRSYPIFTVVGGNSRDSVLLIATELDERIQKVLRVSWARVVNSQITILAGILLTLFVFAAFIAFSFAAPASVLLEKGVIAGEIRDPIQALIFLEKARESTRSPTLLFLSLVAPFALAIGIPYALSIVRPSTLSTGATTWPTTTVIAT